MILSDAWTAVVVLIDLRIRLVCRLHWSVLFRETFPAVMVIVREFVLRLADCNPTLTAGIAIDLLEALYVLSMCRRFASNQVVR